MAQDKLETTLVELAQLHDDFDARREVLDRVSFSILHRPALGGQLIARLCATEEDASELEHLSELLGSVLDAWTHPGKVEASYAVCIASASHLTGLVKANVECRRIGL